LSKFALADLLDFAFLVEWPRFTSFLEKVSNCNGLLDENNENVSGFAKFRIVLFVRYN